MEQVSPFSELFPAAQPAKAPGPNSVEDLGSEDFLALMVAQLENQDPTKPMDNMQFIAQLAQFGSVSGIQELNEAFGGLSSALTGNQALQAASLVGRDVVTDTNVGALREFVDANGDVQSFLDATVEFGGSTGGGNLVIQDMTGRLVYSTPLPPSQGDLKVRWDGLDNAGNALPPGRYRVSAEAMINGQSQSVSVHAHQPVQSVAVDAQTGQLTLELGDGSDISIDEVKAFL